jgi:hypothetical protein
MVVMMMKNNKLSFIFVIMFSVLCVVIVNADGVNLTNQTFIVTETGQTGNDTNISVYDYLHLQLSVNTTNSSTNNSEVWYSWFLDGVSTVKGWGANVVTFFFGTSDIGVHSISVNASTTNDTNATYGNTLTWNPVTVTQPILEVSDLQPLEGSEVYDSVNIYCRHSFTGHTWLYDVDTLVTLLNGSREWQNVVTTPTSDEWNIFDLTPFADTDNNVSVRCRSYNENFGYSNFSYVSGIIKRSINNIKLFRPIENTIFVGQLTAFTTDCDMSNNNKYIILDHFVDGNADGTYDKLLEYNSSLAINQSTFMFDTKFIISGTQKVSVGCIIQKRTTDAWDFSYCKEDQQTCTIQNTYEYEVLS